MLQAGCLTTMDSSSSLGLPRPDYGGGGDSSAGSGAEDRARKRFQRTTSENEDPLRKPGLFSRSNNVTQPSSDPKMNPAGHNRRRSTLRDNNRPLLGPRPLESKRITSESHAAPANRPSFLPTSTSENILAHPHSNFNSRFSYNGQQPRDPSRGRTESSGSTDFLPSVNFDDFHSKITGYEADLDSFPVPGSSTKEGSESPTRTDMGDKGRGPTAVVPAGTGMAFGAGRGQESTGKVTRSSSLARRFSNARRNPAQNPAVDSTAMPPPSAPLAATRGRRQSALPTGPPATTPAAARQPRKSVGPGLITQGFEERRAAREAQPSSGSLSRNTSINKPSSRSTATPSSATVAEGPRLATAARTARTKSLQPPSRNASQGLLNPNMTTPTNANLPSFPGASPGRTPAQRGPTPSSGSGNKRQSQMHHGGLGARTISPTDARRLKRLSIAPPRPPIPQAPLTPQPDALANLHANLHSPVVPHRKNDTPSSARDTPDFARKSGISGVGSLSSSSSFSSLRQPNGGSTSRNSQLGSSSRLPTPKSRNVHSSAGAAEEEVPPVPAIPKAYESPKDLMSSEPAQYFVPRRPSRVESDELIAGRASRGTSVSRAQTGSKLASRPSIDNPRTSVMQPPKPAQSASNSRHRRGLTVGSGEQEKPQPTQRNKRNLQPLTLPPLNLLPLSTPTSNRIASFPAPSLEIDDRHATPPPKRHFAKTPSTPMTASKASFFSRSQRDNDADYQPFNLRAASSHMMGLEGFGRNISPPTPLPIPSPAPRHGQPTPFSSNSLPKGNGDFAHLHHTPMDEYSYDHRVDNNTTNAHIPSPKLPIAPKREEASTRTSNSDEPGTPASSTSLRRKLSLGWKRTSSKASRRDKADADKADKVEREREKDEAKRASKQKEMLPPKFPASATWSGISPTTQEPTARPSFESRFRKSSNNLANTQNSNSQTNNATASQQDTADLSIFINHFPSKEDIPETPPTHEHQHRRVASRSASSSLLTPMQRMLGQKNSLGALKARHLDTNLDKDDLAADKIMEKMGSKRKDFEQAARDIDDLRRRAHPREKCLPAQASQMYPLNIFEKGEIVDYKEIYFCGTQKARKHVGDLDHNTNNFGYDDDRGDYNIVMGDHLSYRYEVVDMLGKGSFGQVVRCIDHKTGLLVAVKIIRNKKRFHQQALVEVNILQKLREWDPDNKHSMINFIQSFYFRGHLCISTELLGMNLYEFIKAYEFKGFPLPLIRRFSRQMLSSLLMLKSKRVIHCDLKPENILLAHPMHSEIKVIDFGSSCFENEKVYTYIQSRFYRSPEVILGMSYGIPIDMWSLGCILAELLTGYPIFPGENEQEQLACIMEIFGPPEKHLIEKSSRKKLFFDSMGKPRVTVSTKGRRRRPSSKTLQQALKCDDDAFLDFISRCLRWDPERRLKPDEAMQHEFVTGLKRQPVSRARMMQGNGPTQSPAKRFPVQTPQRKVTQEGSRPLPEPPATTMRHASGAPPPSSSPINGPGRRHSTFTAGQNGIAGPRTAAQRTVTAGSGIGPSTVGGSNLPRAAPGAGRSVSGRPDMASAAASASLRRPPPS